LENIAEGKSAGSRAPVDGKVSAGSSPLEIPPKTLDLETLARTETSMCRQVRFRYREAQFCDEMQGRSLRKTLGGSSAVPPPKPGKISARSWASIFSNFLKNVDDGMH
jgi:hypothetical protein